MGQIPNIHRHKISTKGSSARLAAAWNYQHSNHSPASQLTKKLPQLILKRKWTTRVAVYPGY